MIVPWMAIAAVAPAQSEGAQERHVLVVETVGFAREEFTSELQLRLPKRKLLSVESPRPERGFVYVHVTRAPPDVVRISIVESDGRAYDRELPHEPNQEVRVAASAIATLLTSVEEGAVAPDRQDVSIPGLDTSAAREAAEPDTSRDGEHGDSRVPQHADQFEVGVDAHGRVGLGIAPTTGAGAYLGAGGGFGAILRFPSGPLLAFGVRVLRRVAEPFRVSRLRVSLVGGYDWRWSSFELLVSAGASLEPWWVREAGRAAGLRYEGQPTNRRPLVGLVGQVAPGYLWRAKETRVALSVGPRLGVAGSFVVHDGARTVRLDRASGGQPAARLGGLELELGVGATLWFSAQSQP